MAVLRDTARAKINLTLEVKGRRADGYHELLSLVAFAELGDELELWPDAELGLEIAGPFSAALEGSNNLILDAAKVAQRAAPALKLGAFRLVKHLPVAAGLGGGSADAASALRLIDRANPGVLDRSALKSFAASLGSDVTVCLDSVPSMMSGRGEKVKAVAGVPACGLLLVNPGVALSAADVYWRLKASPFTPDGAPVQLPVFDGNFEALLDYARPRANDLESPAIALAPEISRVIAALESLPGAKLSKLSGSGATCFALFIGEPEARQAATLVASANPRWWVAATRLVSS